METCRVAPASTRQAPAARCALTSKRSTARTRRNATRRRSSRHSHRRTTPAGASYAQCAQWLVSISTRRVLGRPVPIALSGGTKSTCSPPSQFPHSFLHPPAFAPEFDQTHLPFRHQTVPANVFKRLLTIPRSCIASSSRSYAAIANCIFPSDPRTRSCHLNSPPCKGNSSLSLLLFAHSLLPPPASRPPTNPPSPSPTGCTRFYIAISASHPSRLDHIYNPSLRKTTRVKRPA